MFSEYGEATMAVASVATTETAAAATTTATAASHCDNGRRAIQLKPSPLRVDGATRRRRGAIQRNHCLGDKASCLLRCHPLNDCLDVPPPCPLCLAHSARRSWASDAAVRRCRLLVAVCHSPPSDAPPLVPRRFVGLGGAGAVKQNKINEGLFIKVDDFDARWLPGADSCGRSDSSSGLCVQCGM